MSFICQIVPKQILTHDIFYTAIADYSQRLSRLGKLVRCGPIRMSRREGFCKKRTAIFARPLHVSSPAVKCRGASVGASQPLLRFEALAPGHLAQRGVDCVVTRYTLYAD